MTADSTGPAVAAQGAASPAVPQRAGLVLTTLILVAGVANLPLAVANVALPSIGIAFNASQTQLNLVAVGYSLGLACSVDRKSTRLNSSHLVISYAVFCL